MRCAVISFALLLNSAVVASEVSGRASVIDGDTIEIHGQRIRLYGIEAPESSQHCKAETGKLWRCGQRAALSPSDYIGENTVSCQAKDKDRYGRTIAVCYKGKQDLNGWLVQNGWALAYGKDSRDYVDEEGLARKTRQNIWSGDFTQPWEWRSGIRMRQTSARRKVHLLILELR
jgi:endonuclease YncB( thermonuclease family)